jgi:tubulin--tyrosine ligase
LSTLLRDATLSFEDDVWPQITAIISHVGAAACETMRNDPAALADGTTASCYQLLGWDFLLDANARVHLLEINGSPACAEALRETIVGDLVAILLDGQHASQGTGFQLIWESRQGVSP